MTGRSAQRHPTALLALLAMSPGEGATRDKLIAHLWPESDTRRARHLLSQALHVLRRGLGPDCVTTPSDAVVLNPNVVWTDVGAFQAALAEGRLEDAVELYAGPFLDGFFLSRSHEFDEWAASERNRLAGLYETALQRLAMDAEAGGDAVAAASWWRRLTEHNPHSALVAASYMRALARTGDRAGAVAHAEAFADRLREEYGLPADPEVLALAEELASPPPVPAGEVRRRELEAPLGEKVSGANRPLLPPAPGRRGRRASRARVTSVLLSTLLLAVLGGTAWSWWGPAPGEAVAIAAVAGFAPDGEEAHLARFSERLTDEVRATLAYVPELRLVEGWAAERTVSGTVRRVDGLLVATAVLSDATGDTTWSRELRWADGDTSAALAGLSLAIADSLRLRLAPFRPKRYTESTRAYDRFLQGVYANRRMTHEDLWKALQFYREAYEEDPRFALAHAIAASAYLRVAGAGIGRDEAYAKAREEALRALALDSTLAEGHASLAEIQIWYDRDLRAGERSLRRAMMIYPGLPQARSRYGWYLLMSGGDADAAVASVRRALELDPLNGARSYSVEQALYLARRYDEVPEQHRVTRSLSPDRDFLYQGSFLAAAYRELGRYEDALAEYRRLEESTGESMAADIAVAFARSGRRDEARALLEEVRGRKDDRREKARMLTGIYAALSDHERAFEWLGKGYRTLDDLLLLRRDPVLDPLRDDPRFEAALRRLAPGGRAGEQGRDGSSA